MKYRKISTKLGVVYSCLFAGMMLLVSFMTYGLANFHTRNIVSNEMIASSNVFTRLLEDRASNIRSDAFLQVQDFGFRSAVTLEDGPTVASALDTLRERLKVQSLTYFSLDGDLLGRSGAMLPVESLSEKIVEAADPGAFAREAGIVILDNTPVIVGFVPVTAPDLVGWVVYGAHIDRSQLQELEALAPIQLQAQLGKVDAPQSKDEALQIAGGNFVLTRGMPTLLPDNSVALNLTYSVDKAMAPYRLLFWSLVGVGLLGAVAMSWASWRVAAWLTKPISSLVEAAMRVRDGRSVNVEVDSQDELANLAVEFNHMSTEVRKREAEIKRRARIDLDTELPNRLAFEERLSESDFKADQHFVLAIGIDRFSSIRSAIGFETAAELLKHVAEKATSRDGVTFVSVLPGGLISVIVKASSVSDAKSAIHALSSLLTTTFLMQDTSVDVMVKVGASPVPSEQPADALKNAMIALEQAYTGHLEFAFFDKEQYDRISDNLSMMGDLMKALDAGAVSVVYQPKFDLRTQEPVGVEALVRWEDKDRGKVFPDQFIPLAEETGHIEPLTFYVLQASVLAQETFRQSGYDLCMSVNASARLIGNKRFVERALDIVRKSSGEFCFEITETAVIEDPERAIASIGDLSDEGIMVSIDDYGSGLSSLSYLKQLPASELKIDKEFVLNIERSKRDALLVRSTIDLAHSLNMKVTAEGIETNTAAALLAGMGCDIGQGFGLGRPMPADDLIKFLDNYTASQVSSESEQAKTSVAH